MAEELTATQGISACPDCCAAIGAPCAAGMPGHGYDCLDCGVNWSELEIRSVWVRFGLVVGVSMLATLSMISFMWVADTEWWKVISLVLIGMILIWCMDRVER